MIPRFFVSNNGALSITTHCLPCNIVKLLFDDLLVLLKAALQTGDRSAGAVPQLSADAANQRLVVRHQNDAAGELVEGLCQAFHRFNIEVISGLVEDQHVRTKREYKKLKQKLSRNLCEEAATTHLVSVIAAKATLLFCPPDRVASDWRLRSPVMPKPPR